MARVTTYLIFPGSTETAFEFYRSIFGGEFSTPIARFKDMPACPGQPSLSPKDENMVMHVGLTILGGHVLMGSDSPESRGLPVINGNNVHINLESDTRAETERLFNALSVGGVIEMPLQDMFWGAYYGSLADKFGIHWMFNCPN